jgi:hypothetical protein
MSHDLGRSERFAHLRAAAVVVAALVVSGVSYANPPTAGEAAPPRSPGFVDGSSLLALAGEDAVTVEVALSGAILQALVRVDPEVASATQGLESIHALILEIKDAERADRVRKRMLVIEEDLLGKGWQRLARVRDDGAHVRVLARGDGKAIQGLVVMVADESEHEIVFANLAGAIDLEAVAKIGASFDVPGLDEIRPRED